MKPTFYLLFALLLLPAAADAARLTWLEQIPLESYEKMRETERYQLGIAEKYYIKEEYKVALDEYEKFLTLYESSTGAPYAQLMWSHCEAKLRRVNTAIREGFQSVIDYWPNSREAVLAAYLIGHSYQEIGEVEKAKVAYGKLMETYPKDHVTVLAKVKLLEMATVAQKEEDRLELLEELTYNTPRTEESIPHCERASMELATFYFYAADWPNGLKALESSFVEAKLGEEIYDQINAPIRTLNGTEEDQPKAKDLADKAIAFIEAQIPVDMAEDANKALARDRLNRMAGLYQAIADNKAVIATYERTGKLIGIDDALLGQIAGFYKGITERDKARETYRRFENQIEAERNLVYMLREEKKMDEAITGYRGLVEQDPDRIDEYLWAIAECYEGKSDWKNAIQTFRQCDRYPANYFRMAQCHRRMKEWPQAIQLYGQAKAHEGSGPEALIQIGLTYEDAGQKENAIKTLQLTCRTYPKTSQASRAHAHLQTKYDITVTLGGAKDE
ncbi:MAG: tetratricopeptide (TPR) repeat protein [Verrucomicrobiales bacterium]|jgi:tetratricopeptide (TPR) repeat protein